MRMDEPDYTLAECIDALDGYLAHGETFYPVELAESAAYWLTKHGGDKGAALALRGWLLNSERNMSVALCKSTLEALRACLPVEAPS